MRKDQSQEKKNIFIMKVTLDSKERPYRVLAIPKNLTLYNLGLEILKSFDFDFDHLFGFYDNLRDWTKSKERYELRAVDLEEESTSNKKRKKTSSKKEEPELTEEELEELKLFWEEYFKNLPKSVKKVEIKDCFQRVRKKMLFLYDYGNEWHFIVELVKTEIAKDGIEYPVIVESFGKAPPQYPGENEEEEEDSI